MSDEIHILPAEGQSAEEVAEIFTNAARSQGLDADAINVDGDEVIVPEDIAANLRTNLGSFPPVNQLYTLKEPVHLSATDTTGPTGVLQGFDVIVGHNG
ncbi:hypothetical protein [Actinokineospora sp. HUAS TT18]|uniref:hypothetical protein n=1 Tax=Actinokineospora sp. HUAS TT18 TaxID=3447451 RepID=UPI003F52178D